MVERAKEEGVRLMREAEAQAQAQSHVDGAREREEEVRRVEEENERARVERVRAEKVRLAKEIAETERLLAERSRERLVTPTTTSDRVVMSQGTLSSVFLCLSLFARARQTSPGCLADTSYWSPLFYQYLPGRTLQNA